MREFLVALALSVIPVLRNIAGGLIAEVVAVSWRTLSLALHGAAGIVLAVVGVELMPRALGADPAWLPVLAFVAGGAFFLAVDRAIGLVRRLTGGGEAGPWAIFFGVAVDLFSDGVMIGTGSTIGLGLALLLAPGQAPADMPEGFATIATFEAGMSRRRRLLLTAALALPILAGTTVGYWAVLGRPEVVQLALLAFTAGILTTVVVEEIVPEAHEDGEARFAALVLVGGFGLFTLLSTYLDAG